MSTPLYVFKAHKINVTNLVQYHIINYAPEKFLKNCSYRYDDKFLFSTEGVAVKEISQITHIEQTRHTVWTPYIELLETYVDQAIQSSQCMMFGNHDMEQVSLLKSHFGDRMISVCINYDRSWYQYLLNNIAQYHVYMLTNNLIKPNSTDLEVLKDLPKSVEYYRRAFDQIKLIPEESINHGDYNIQLDDFFDSGVMEQHFANLGFPNNKGKHGIYYDWLANVIKDNELPNYSGNIN